MLLNFTYGGGKTNVNELEGGMLLALDHFTEVTSL